MPLPLNPSPLVCSVWSLSILQQIDCSPANGTTIPRVKATWKQATTPLPCARDPRCRGIQTGEFYFEHSDGRAVHAIGACRDRRGKLLPAFPWDESSFERDSTGQT